MKSRLPHILSLCLLPGLSFAQGVPTNDSGLTARDIIETGDREADLAVQADKLARAAVGADKQLISGAEVFDVYKGVELEGRKSIAIAVTLQPTEATLTDKEIEAVSAKIVANVEKQTGGSLRG